MTAVRQLPVTVIVPCHDDQDTIENALDSIAQQTQPPVEVIVVDDASTDSTPAVLERCEARRWPFRLRTVRLPANRGPGEARNVGWSLVDESRRYVAFLDADDGWLPEKLERQVTWMECHPDVAWTSHRCSVPGANAGTSPRRPDIRVMPITRRGLLSRNAVATPTVLARNSVRGRFRGGWRHCEDLMLWLDWLHDGARGAMLDETWAALGRRPGSKGGATGDLAAMYRGEIRVIRTLVAECRMSSLEAAAWRVYAWLRYLRRRTRR